MWCASSACSRRTSARTASRSSWAAGRMSYMSGMVTREVGEREGVFGGGRRDVTEVAERCAAFLEGRWTPTGRRSCPAWTGRSRRPSPLGLPALVRAELAAGTRELSTVDIDVAARRVARRPGATLRTFASVLAAVVRGDSGGRPRLAPVGRDGRRRPPTRGGLCCGRTAGRRSTSCRGAPDGAGTALPSAPSVEVMTDDVLDIPFADAFAFDPSPTWARLRENRPVARVRTLAGARGVAGDPVRRREAGAGGSAVLAGGRGGGGRAAGRRVPADARNSLTTTDPPEHTRLRKLVSATFAHRRIERTRPWVRELCAQLADERCVDGADIRQVYALPLPIQVICQLLGVPYEDRERFREWTELGYSMEMAEKDLGRGGDGEPDRSTWAPGRGEAARTPRPAEDLLDELSAARRPLSRTSWSRSR